MHICIVGNSITQVLSALSWANLAQCLERPLRAPMAPRRTNDMDALFSHDVRNIRIQWVLNETHDFSMSQGGGTHNMPPGWGGTHASWLYVQLQACWLSCSTITFRQATHISFVQTAWGLSPHLHARCLEYNSWCLHMHACMHVGGRRH